MRVKHSVSEDIPRIAYEDAMNIYGSDKPDLRFGMTLVDLDERLRRLILLSLKTLKKLKRFVSKVRLACLAHKLMPSRRLLKKALAVWLT